MNADMLLSRLTMLDFAAVDLALYLNTHPYDTDTIEKYNEVVEEADKLRMIYEDNVGPIYSFRSVSDKKCFSWVDNPWPQTYCFNCQLNEKECC